MGGMGTIHDNNEATIYEENHTMVQNLLKTASLPGSTVKKFFYASSACVYHHSLQTDKDVSLRESDVFVADALPRPQGLYGLEKLNSELLLTQYADKFDIRIARFHNIYGSGGSWNNGREKVPAAFLRKALTCRRLMDRSQRLPEFEIWGDGTQRRSFLYIDDAVEAILKLISSSYTKPINVGSDQAVTIQELAELALRCAGAQAEFTYDNSKPVGVSSRNSNNDVALSELGWAPSISLEEGMARTCKWIRVQLDNHLACFEGFDSELDTALEALRRSDLVDLEAERLRFAIILPITSRGLSTPGDCLENLRNFVQTLKDTTWRDTHFSGDQRFSFTIYLVIDADDEYLLEDNKATHLIMDLGISSCHIHHLINSSRPRGHVCAMWRDCARQAYNDGCDYFVLMGDDVTIMDDGWMRKSHSWFDSLSKSTGLPFGLGCVAFTDESFPGMPTFPIIHRTHMDIFGGEVVPDIFVNQDGDPFLFQLYRRWGASEMFPCRLRNGIGGSITARYAKQHASNWSLEPLARAEKTIATYLRNQHRMTDSQISSLRKLTLDVIIPCYRVDLTILSRILSLKAPTTTSVNFIIIIDSPRSPYLPSLLATYSSDPKIRIRVNDSNLGASYSRNRGLSEASAEWVHFLDDDIVPSPDLFFAVSDAIRANPTAAGFVCNTEFPVADSLFTTAVHLSGVTYFWDIATKIAVDIPWGVTANLVSRRVIRPLDPAPETDIPVPTTFSLAYPKTGGGEDIDYCLTQRVAHLAVVGPGPGRQYPGFLGAPEATVTHPWWNEGKRSYWRFHKWSLGDGHLIDVYPELSYLDHAPNSAECFLLCAFIFVIGTIFLSSKMMVFSAEGCLCIFVANIVHDVYRHAVLHPERNKSLDIHPRIRKNRLLWILAIMESSLIRQFSELGRLRGMIEKREWRSLGKRFDWFVGRIPGDGPRKEERRNSTERVGLTLALVAAIEGWKAVGVVVP
ncbi:GDP-mannose 3,5-epimerase 2 [Leucoagaricus sp. SymC.cos]|nr:GDP-mannose 3,5-epimerase 2 [Leucoagaricus sp. SymC.cos]